MFEEEWKLKLVFPSMYDISVAVHGPSRGMGNLVAWHHYSPLRNETYELEIVSV